MGIYEDVWFFNSTDKRSTSITNIKFRTTSTDEAIYFEYLSDFDLLFLINFLNVLSGLKAFLRHLTNKKPFRNFVGDGVYEYMI